MIILGHPLVPAPPRGPVQNLANGLLGHQHEPPAEAANLGDTQGDLPLHAALHAARLFNIAWASIFWQWALLQVPCSHDGQQRVRPHGQGDMLILPRPTPDLVVIQVDCVFGRFNTALNRPAGARRLHHLWRIV